MTEEKYLCKLRAQLEAQGGGDAQGFLEDGGIGGILEDLALPVFPALLLLFQELRAPVAEFRRGDFRAVDEPLQGPIAAFVGGAVIAMHDVILKPDFRAVIPFQRRPVLAVEIAIGKAPFVAHVPNVPHLLDLVFFHHWHGNHLIHDIFAKASHEGQPGSCLSCSVYVVAFENVLLVLCYNTILRIMSNKNRRFPLYAAD